MSNKKYYYFPPTRAQFFFPKKTFNEFKNYYTPFSVKAKLFWLLFLYVPRFKNLFVIKESKLPEHFKKVREIIDIKEGEIFYNIGTSGPEQKTTAIGKNNTKERFIKFGETIISKKLINNEANILKKLNKNKSLPYIPSLLKNYSCDSYSFLITNAIDGEKLQNLALSERVFEVLVKLPLQGKNKNGLHEIFSHGDFCPWNLLIDFQKNIIPIDWEMAGDKTLGYDLFTFIFHTNFLIKPTKDAQTLLNENVKWIERYFGYFKIINYKDYLHSFAEQRVEQERTKSKNSLYLKYIKLLNLNE